MARERFDGVVGRVAERLQHEVDDAFFDVGAQTVTLGHRFDTVREK